MADRIHTPSAEQTLRRSDISTRTQQENISKADEIIVSLASSYENKRERQVLEWERLRRQRSEFSEMLL